MTPATPFDQLGGLDGIRRLVDRFYDLMDTAPEAAEIRHLHAASLKRSREKLHARADHMRNVDEPARPQALPVREP